MAFGSGAVRVLKFDFYGTVVDVHALLHKEHTPDMPVAGVGYAQVAFDRVISDLVVKDFAELADALLAPATAH
jgi:hypothetical protein